MIVISDTTPIISLLKINKLSLLQILFKNVIIPQAVYNELISNPKYTNEAVIIFNTSYISIKKVENRQQVDELRNNSGLDIGESEAIAYSKMVNADLLLMDELKGRSVAKQLGLSITGTIGILIQAFNENLISKEEILKSIKVLKESGRYISESLYNRLVARIS